MVTAIKSEATSVVTVDTLAVRFQTKELSSVLATLARIADHRSTMPMLANVRIRVLPSGAVILSATDLNLSATVSGPAWLGSSGDLCVPAKQLADIVKAMPGSDVTLDRSGPLGLRVASGDASMTLIGHHCRDFPKLPDPAIDGSGDITYVDTGGPALADMFDAVSSSICKDDTRFHLNGTLVESDGTTVRMVTTDGHRLTRHDAPLRGPLTPGIIVPSKSAGEIARLLRAEKGAACSWAVTKTHLFVRCGAWTIATKLIDAQFPAYDQVIPKDHEKLATVERKPLIAALKRAAKFCGRTRGVKLSFASGKLTLVSDHPDTGTARESMLAQSQWLDEGGAADIGVNPHYLLDALTEIGDRCVTLAFGAALDPVLVRSTDDATSYSVNESRYLCVIMPMRI